MRELPDIYDDRPPKKERHFPTGIAAIVLLVALAAGAWRWFRPRPVELPAGGPIRVVKQRPGGALKPAGAKVSEPEAILTLRRHLAKEAKNECIAISSQGFDDGFYGLTAVDSCKSVRLGRWKVDAASGALSR